MQTKPSIFPRTIATRVIALGRNLAVLATLASAYPSSGGLIPIGCIEIRGSGDAFQVVLRDDSDEAVSDLVLHVTDDSIAGALLAVQGLPRGYVLTVEPSGRPAGDAALYRGDSLLVLQPPLIGDTDAWTLQIHAPTAHAGVTAIVAGMIVEVHHREANDACEPATGVEASAGGSSFDPSLIVVRIKPAPTVPPVEDWPY